jgi:hypothetical protein
MKMKKKKIIKDDGRYLIFYTFEEKEDEDVRIEMESCLEGMGNNGNSPAKQDL